VEQVNAVIASHLPVSISFVSKEDAASFLDLSKLPDEAGNTVRVVRVGDYDACACIGMHVKNTSEIGKFVILSHDYQEGVWRIRFKLEQPEE
jgi:alanyl-tRNA synthetase